MKKLILCRWIPASWKSTWAKVQKWAVILNKDTIRQGLHNGVWSKENEKEVVKLERELCEWFMKKGVFIIVDNTHLWKNNKHIAFYKALAEKYSYEFEMKDFYVSREEALKRDKVRENPVGVEVIDRMIKMSANGGYPSRPTYTKQDTTLPPAYIFDIDGTLAHMNGRSPYDYTKVGEDIVNEPIRNLLLDLCVWNDVIIMSGREDSCEKETREWLKKHDIPFLSLHMRKTGDTRKDTIVKKEMYNEHIRDTYNVLGVFDDRNSVVDMWRLELGLPCMQVWYGNF